MKNLCCIFVIGIFLITPLACAPQPPLPPVSTPSATSTATPTDVPTPSPAQPTPTPDPNKLYCPGFVYDGVHLMCGGKNCNLAAGDRECHAGGCSCSAQH